MINKTTIKTVLITLGVLAAVNKVSALRSVKRLIN
ncbi:structural protein [Pseudoalteromonas phage Cr39582]|uniref:Structural protein n=1 Tax=Pseudoalteromonas phage Cr39582 TaxID=2099852 RepID=A0A2P1CL24_9VIRU|nr:virion structural protein [Pseudoalteromonas phage Cr39582]AVJ51874.1 structural protein [Pseudoalteromonas phage Cr39582]